MKQEAEKCVKFENDGSYLERFLKAKAEGRLESFLAGGVKKEEKKEDEKKSENELKRKGEELDDEPDLQKKNLNEGVKKN